jgi:hypothetical protein
MADRKKVPYPAYPIRWEMFTNLSREVKKQVAFKEDPREAKDAALKRVLKGGYFRDCGSITGNALHLELDCAKLMAEAAKGGVSSSQCFPSSGQLQCMLYVTPTSVVLGRSTCKDLVVWATPGGLCKVQCRHIVHNPHHVDHCL